LVFFFVWAAGYQLPLTLGWVRKTQTGGRGGGPDSVGRPQKGLQKLGRRVRKVPTTGRGFRTGVLNLWGVKQLGPSPTKKDNKNIQENGPYKLATGWGADPSGGFEKFQHTHRPIPAAFSLL